MPLIHDITLDNGVHMPTAYVVIREIRLQLITERAYISAAIYYDSTTYTGGLPEVITMEHRCDGNDFDTYFDDSVLNQLNKNTLSQA